LGHSKGGSEGKFIAMNAYNTEGFQINDPVLHLKLLGKQEQAKPKTSRRREITKIRTEINKIETKKTHTRNRQNKKLVLKR
jgi:hypothetical protein